MNILGELNRARIQQATRKATTMKKERYGKREKTIHCGAPGCGKSGSRIRFGREVRILCRDHIIQLNARHEEHAVTKDTFKKASQL